MGVPVTSDRQSVKKGLDRALRMLHESSRLLWGIAPSYKDTNELFREGLQKAGEITDIAYLSVKNLRDNLP